MRVSIASYRAGVGMPKGYQALCRLACTGLAALAITACAARGGAEPGTSIVGSTWLAQTIDGSPSPVYPSFTLNFDGATLISGRAGCTGYTATVGVAGDQIAVGPLQMSPIPCEEGDPGPTGIFLGALASSTHFNMTEWTLALIDVTGRTRLTFTRTTNPL